jgi:hypothetical protein
MNAQDCQDNQSRDFNNHSIYTSSNLINNKHPHWALDENMREQFWIYIWEHQIPKKSHTQPPPTLTLTPPPPSKRAKSEPMECMLPHLIG